MTYDIWTAKELGFILFVSGIVEHDVYILRHNTVNSEIYCSFYCAYFSLDNNNVHCSRQARSVHCTYYEI